MATEIRSLRESEFEEHAELVYISYSYGRELQPGSMLTQPDWWLRGVRSNSYYDPEQTRVMVMDGKLVSSVSCYMRPSYIAGRIVRAVCIGSVCTHPEHRRQGLLRQVLANAREWMMDQGVLWSFLYGAEAVYGSSGWRNMTAWVLRVNLQVSEEFGGDISLRPVEPARDLSTLARIYDTFNSRLTGPTQRTEEYWRSRILGAKAPNCCLLDRAGNAIGYYKGADGDISEIGWVESPRDVLAVILRQWPGQTVSLPVCSSRIVADLQAISALSTQREHYQHGGRITLAESYQGLWQYHQDPDGLFPEFNDTGGLIRFLREHDYVMWSADKC
jgi:GNAT superfamily N-acetyltransferase